MTKLIASKSLENINDLPHISKILKQLMFECGIKEAELARQTSIPQTTINRLLLTESTDPRATTLIPIAKFFSVTVGQLIGQEPLTQERITGTYNPTNKSSWTNIPVISWEEIQSWIFKKGKLTPYNHTKWIATEREVSEGSFALKTLKFMEPRFKRGSTIIVDPKSLYNDGNYVIVSFKNSEPTIRKLIKDGPDIYLVKLYGDEKPTPLNKNEVSILGTIVETRINEK